MYTLKLASRVDGRIRRILFQREKNLVEHQINLSDCSYPFIPIGGEGRFRVNCTIEKQ